MMWKEENDIRQDIEKLYLEKLSVKYRVKLLRGEQITETGEHGKHHKTLLMVGSS
jgi:hypothetical protein